jgi:hypothetical protein
MAEQPEKIRRSIAGRWHLVDVNSPEDQLPPHRVDLVFRDGPKGLHGAILSHRDGEEIPLQSVSFTGAELRLQMAPRPGTSGSNLPFLVLAAVEDRFEGGWTVPGTERLRLKLIRARD